jgi:hypothetical protein
VSSSASSVRLSQAQRILNSRNAVTPRVVFGGITGDEPDVLHAAQRFGARRAVEQTIFIADPPSRWSPGQATVANRLDSAGGKGHVSAILTCLDMSKCSRFRRPVVG